MDAASRGAASAGATSIGVLPGTIAPTPTYVSVAIPTGLGELRNGLVVSAAEAIIAIGGAYATLSEVALGLRRACGWSGWTRGRLTGSSRRRGERRPSARSGRSGVA